MITIPQIKAARALVSWGQRELSKRSGLSLATIAQLESGKGNPRKETLQLIQTTLEREGVRFSDEPGVRMQSEPFSVLVWQGRESMLTCWKDIEETLGPGGTVMISCVDDPLWKSLYPQEMLHMYKSRTRLKIITRGLLTDPSKNHSGWHSQNYRIVPEAATSPQAPYYVYGDRVALIKMIDPIRIVRIENRTVAESFRTQFQYHWDAGKSYD